MAKKRRRFQPGREVHEYRLFPGDSGKVMRLVYGEDDYDLAEILDEELKDEQQRNPGSFKQKYRGSA